VFVGDLPNTTKESGTGTSESMKEHDSKKAMENIGNTIYLIAAKHGIVEITSKLESKMKSVIHDRNGNDENVLLLAVKYRQPQVVEQLRTSRLIDHNIFQSLCQQVDKQGNTVLHLAADVSVEETWSNISGPAMQMMWDIKWYKEHLFIFSIETI
jgi:ankyrin repeat protein